MNKPLVIGIVVVIGIFAVGGFLLWQVGLNQVSPTPVPAQPSVQQVPPPAPSPKETRWMGLLTTENSILKIDSQNESSNYYINQQPFLPPGVSVEFWESLTDYADERREHFLKLWDDGTIVFIGSPEIPTAPEQNTLYKWTIDSTKEPTPLVWLPVGQKIKLFLFSPGKERVAVVAVTRTEEEVYEDEERLEGLPIDKQLEEIQKRVEVLQDERRTILVYDVKSGERINSIKIGPDQPISPDEGFVDYEIKKILWNEAGLFVIPLFAEAGLLDPDKKQTISTLNGDYRWNEIEISSDGKYYVSNDFVIRNVYNGEGIAKVSLDDFEPKFNVIALGPKIFSPDSKKVIVVVASDPTYSDFAVFETDIEAGNTERVGGLEDLEEVWGIPKSAKDIDVSFQEHIESLGVWFLPYAIFYDPRGEFVNLVIRGFENPNRSRLYGYSPRFSLITLRQGGEETRTFDLPALVDYRAHTVRFLGWYREDI